MWVVDICANTGCQGFRVSFNMSFMKFAVSWVVRKIACFNMVVLHVAF